MACLDWSAQHTYHLCSQAGRSKKAVKGPWSFASGCMDHFITGTSYLVSENSPETDGEVPTTAALLQEQFPDHG